MAEHALSNLLYLWPRRTLFIGTLTQPIGFSQAAASVIVSLGDPMELTMPGMAATRRFTSLLLPAGRKVVIDTGGAAVAACYLDAPGQDYALLARSQPEGENGVYINIAEEAGLLDLYTALRQRPMTPELACRELERRINPRGRPYEPVDPRVEAVIRLIQANIAENTSVEELASAVNLSVSRLVQLFREHVGVPIRRYRQWHRLFVTVAGVERGETLTSAAIAAGFTDSAHFSHTFRMTLGMTPSDILAMLAGRLFVEAETS